MKSNIGILALASSLSIFISAAGCGGAGSSIRDTGPGDGGPASLASWMSHYKGQLSGMTLKQLVVLGAHDSASADINPGSPPCWGEIRSTDGGQGYGAPPTQEQLLNARTQSASILEQLNAGVRYLDLRVALQDGGYYSEHMWLSTPFDGDGGILDQVSRFSKINPQEIVIITTYPSHVYSDETGNGMATQDQVNAYFEMVRARLSLLPVPQGNPMQATLGSLWDGGAGGVIYYGPSGVEASLQPYIWDSEGISSDWMQAATTPAELIAALDEAVIQPWLDGGSTGDLHVLQAMTNDKSKIQNAADTNAAVIGRLISAWANAPVNVVQVNDSVEASDAGIMPVLFGRMNLK